MIFTEIDKTDSEPPTFSYWELTKAGKEMHRIISGEIKEDIQRLSKALHKNNEKTIKKLSHTTYTDIQKSEINLDLTQEVSLHFN